MPSCSPGGAEKDTEQKSYSLVSNQMHRFDVESERYIFYTTSIDIRQPFPTAPGNNSCGPFEGPPQWCRAINNYDLSKGKSKPQDGHRPSHRRIKLIQLGSGRLGLSLSCWPCTERSAWPRGWSMYPQQLTVTVWSRHTVVPMVDPTNLVWGKDIFSDPRTLKVGAI